MAECLVSESARVRDGAAAGLPGAKVFRAQHLTHARAHARDRETRGQTAAAKALTHARAHARDRPAPQAPPAPKSFAILEAG